MSNEQQLAQSPVYNVVDPAFPRPEQTFTTTDGKPWDFTQLNSEKITLLYFGYTSCPDVCPTTMADLALALNQVPESVAKKVDVVFISTDPKRDTPEQIARWLDRISPNFIGLRAELPTVTEAALNYGIHFDIPDDTDGNYLVAHGEQVIVLAPDGAGVGYFTPDFLAPDAKELLPVLVAEYV